jgi:hypothetical protein
LLFFLFPLEARVPRARLFARASSLAPLRSRLFASRD